MNGRAVLLALAALLAAAPARAETRLAESQVPVHSTFQSPPPEGAEIKPGLSVLGMKLPALPQVKMPEMPSLPDMLTAVGAFPEKIGLPNANHLVDAQFDRLVQKLNIAIPAIETLGYEVRNFEVEWTLPPQVRVRLQSSEEVSDAEYAHVLASVKGDLILESIILSLGGVRKIQRAGDLAPFKRAVIEVDLTIPPKVIMTFSDPTNKFHDRFTDHHAALRKAISDGKPFPERKGAPDPVPAPGAVPPAK
ncbi:MAG: hypothetical protein WCO00_10925 [Rhodospirillaceae bacterium]